MQISDYRGRTETAKDEVQICEEELVSDLNLSLSRIRISILFLCFCT